MISSISRSAVQRVVIASVLVLILVQLFNVNWLRDGWSTSPTVQVDDVRSTTLAVTPPPVITTHTVTAEPSTATVTVTSSTVSTAAAAGATAAAYPHLTPADLSNSSSIALIIKTGATEALRRIPIHALTTFSHVPTFSIFSDMAQSIGPLTLHDSLAGVSPEYIEDHPDFALYRQLSSGKIDPDTAPNLDGAWMLDKYKNLQIAQLAQKRHPDARWFVFVDADSYVLWHNLHMWLSALDSAHPLYLGSLALYRFDGQADLFAHGGSGYIVSAEALQRTVVQHPDIPFEYEEKTNRSCCGDHIFGLAMKDYGVPVKDGRPVITGEPPRSLFFEKESMCKPIVTMHHMTSLDMIDVWEFERRVAKPGKPILFVDVFDHFVATPLAEMAARGGEREGWDNMAKGLTLPLKNAAQQAALHEVVQRAHEGVDQCREACESRGDCFQWKWKKGQCVVGEKVIRLGSETEEMEWTSGWLVGKIMDMRNGVVPCTSEKGRFPWVGGHK